ncbi:hypothetical protein [Pantoea sp. ACRSB]|uniref:hypothetical protein n=1 Tax=Pantoea sp. ACRSB TaxID=2918207 RepID=UPI0028933E27|nr:hypothetical protein [Pantoea sp. ACRSB]MCG7388780.1 hypothetical protein [Pantoea sp. ACRSB]
MKKLTAEKCRERITHLSRAKRMLGVSMAEEDYLEALEIALPVLEQQEQVCPKCGGTGMADSGGIQPWGEQILVECDCQFEQQVKDNDGWIEWAGGENPAEGKLVQVEFRDGFVDDEQPSGGYRWYHEPNNCDIIAYRVVQQERERGEEE